MKLALTATVFLAGGISANIAEVFKNTASLFGEKQNGVWAENGQGRRFFENCHLRRPAKDPKTLQTDSNLADLYRKCGTGTCYIEYNLERKDEDCYKTYSDSNKLGSCLASQFLSTIACDCRTEPHPEAPHGTTPVKEGNNIICRPNAEPRRQRLRSGDHGYDILCKNKCFGTSCDVITKAYSSSYTNNDEYEFSQCNCDDCINKDGGTNELPPPGTTSPGTTKTLSCRGMSLISRIFVNDDAVKEQRCARKCPKGNYLDERRIYNIPTNDETHFYTCTPCPKGTYKAADSVTWNEECTPCGAGMTTAATGSQAITSCIKDTSLLEASATRTAAPETAAPETAAPETAAPVTAAPETEAPETAAPETAAPETAAPETANPTTQAPSSAEPKNTERPRPPVNQSSSTSSLAFTFLGLVGVMLH